MAFDHKDADEQVAALKPDKTYPRWVEQPLVKGAIEQIVRDAPQHAIMLDTLLRDAFKSGHSYGAAGITVGLLAGIMQHAKQPRRSVMDELNDIIRK